MSNVFFFCVFWTKKKRKDMWMLVWADNSNSQWNLILTILFVEMSKFKYPLSETSRNVQSAKNFSDDSFYFFSVVAGIFNLGTLVGLICCSISAPPMSPALALALEQPEQPSMPRSNAQVAPSNATSCGCPRVADCGVHGNEMCLFSIAFHKCGDSKNRKLMNMDSCLYTQVDSKG